jgi:hypothetical protein
MSNESTPQGPTERPRSGLPQFDPDAPAGTRTGDTQLLPSAWATHAGDHPVAPPATPYAYAAAPASASTPPPSGAGRQGRRWSGRRTALTAGLAVVLGTVGAVGAAAALRQGSVGDDGDFHGPGGFGGVGGRHGFGLRGGQQNQNGLPNQGLQNQQGTLPQQLPNLQGGGSGQGLNGIDPNQPGGLSPQQLLQQLQQLGQDDQGFDHDHDHDHDHDGTVPDGSGGSGGSGTSGGVHTT